MPRHVVILAGGVGTRLWPFSRERHPKHLLALYGKQSLLQATFHRVRRLTAEVYIVTERSQVDDIHAQLPDLPEDHLIIEPGRRGTASALALASFTIARRDSNATMISVHADHAVGPDDEAYLHALEAEAEWAESQGALATVGLEPAHPSTAFGYIQLGARAEGPLTTAAFRVKAFVEKPDIRTAEAYVNHGDYLWNLGLFSWPVSVLFGEMAKHAPDLYAGFSRFTDAAQRGDEAAARAEYLALPTETIDDAVLERTRNLLAVRAEFDWHDVGSWADLHDTLAHDEAGNFVEGDHVLIDSRNNLIRSPRKLVAAVGLEGMIVVETDDALLIVPKSRSQDVKLIVEHLKQIGKKEYV